MKVSNDQIIQKDTEYLIDNPPVEWENFRDKSVFITGATGLIGSQLTRIFILANKTYELGMKIYALVRDEEKSERLFSEIGNSSGLQVIVQDMTDNINISDNINYIFHCANITDSWSFVHNPVETIETTFVGCRNILKFSKECHADSVVYLSTMEIYGQSEEKYINESGYGYLDPIAVRSSYPEAKRICECMCISYAKEYGVPVKIVRPIQTFGPGVNWDDNRVFAQFARDVLEKKDIILHTSGRTVRSYCYTRDLVAALMIVLLHGENGEAYNIANEETEISIYDMAQMLTRKYSDGNFKVVIEKSDDKDHGYNPEGRTCICCDKIKSLGWSPEVGIEEMFDNLIASMGYEMAGRIDS